jgi:hypothetical protein
MLQLYHRDLALSMDDLIIDKFSIFSYNNLCYAVVAELADALDSGSSGRKAVRVQIPPSAPLQKMNTPQNTPQTKKP